TIAVLLLAAVWRERRMLQLQLADEVTRGTLDERQYRTALSAGLHVGARMRALGSGRLLAPRRFYRLCGELAHKKQQLARLGDADGASLLVEKLREEMRRLAPL